MRIGDNIPSRTPEGDRLHCEVCDRTLRLEVSLLSQDATCPFCGALVWKEADAPEEMEDQAGNLFDIPHYQGLIGAVVNAEQREAGEWTQKRVQLAAEMEGLCFDPAIDAMSLLEGFTKRLVEAMESAVGVVVWELPQLGAPMLLVKQGGAPESSFDPAHLLLVESVAERTQPIMVLPRTVPTIGSAMSNSTQHLLLLAPLPRVGGSTLVLEVFEQPESDVQTQRGDLRFLTQVIHLLAFALRRYVRVGDAERLLVLKDSLLARWVAWLCRRLGMVESRAASRLEPPAYVP
jgi:hypothetical protein